MNPYRIPEHHDFTVIHFSGGKTSGYLLWHILEAHGGKLPDNAIAVYCNTGKEVEQTLAFIHRFEQETGCPVTWLEYWRDDTAAGGRKDPKNKHRVVGFETASRNGEPFAQMIKAKNYLPNVKHRICTAELKVQTCEYYMRRDRGITEWRDVIGFRHDEPRRWSKAIKGNDGNEKCRSDIRDYPLVLAGVTRQMVEDFWAGMPWRLEMDSRYGNCDICFLKGKRNILNILREDPSRADWWIEMEELMTNENRTTKDKSLAFGKDWNYSDLQLIATSQTDMFPDIPDDSPNLPCFCFD